MKKGRQKASGWGHPDRPQGVYCGGPPWCSGAYVSWRLRPDPHLRLSPASAAEPSSGPRSSPGSLCSLKGVKTPAPPSCPITLPTPLAVSSIALSRPPCPWLARPPPHGVLHRKRPATDGTKFAGRGVKGSEPVNGAEASCQAGTSVGYSFSTDHGVSRTLDESWGIQR